MDAEISKPAIMRQIKGYRTWFKDPSAVNLSLHFTHTV